MVRLYMVRKNYFASCGCNPRNVYFYSCNDCGGDLLLCGKINDKGHMNTPTEPGYYWLKTGNNPWVIVRIREKGGLVWIDDSWFMFPSNEARWSDRIPEPEGE